ncbi:MAG: LemA family protein [Bacteroidaceae bacterium]|nr:LemA family protein [Bacteroidaceae bacterium]
MNLSKSTITILIVVLGVLALGGCVGSKYNSIVTKDESVTRSWNDLQSAYQRRADLIPNLVNTVKGYAKHESETLQGVVQARAKATQITLDPSKATPEQVAAFQQAQGELSQALGKLLAVTENYPDLKANENFSQLQAQLEGTENRINESRKLYNAEVQGYNVLVRSFPMNIFAGMFGFEKRNGFEATPQAQNAPSVQF